MNYSNYRITLDVRKTVASVQLTAKKGDAGRKIYITLSDKGSPCQIADGCYAVFAGRKPDGTLLYNKTTIEDNTIIYAMTQQTTAVAGLVACEVKLFDSMSNLLTSPKLTILVDDVVVSEEDIVSKDEVTALTELVLDATATRELANQAIDGCNAATGAANTAAQAANTAAGNAEAAAGNAMSKANVAEEAAAAANDAAGLANQATVATNNAASEARDATEETNAARENIVREAGEILASLSDAVYAAPIECTANGDVIALSDASNQQLAGLTLYGKTVQNGTPTPSAPVALESVGESIGVTVAGKNLLPFPYATTAQTMSGVTFTHGTDGTITCNGTASEKLWYQLNKNFVFLPGVTYTLSGGYAGGTGDTYILYCEGTYNGAGFFYADTGNGITFSFENGATGKIYIMIAKGITVSNIVFRPQVEIGNTATVYEPYKGQTLTATAEGGLCGIGEVKDEIDFARGVRVQRNALVDLGTLDWLIDTNNAGFSCFRSASRVDFRAGTGHDIMRCTSYDVRPWRIDLTADKTIAPSNVNGNTTVWIRDDSYTDVATFKASLQGVMLLYARSTPIETPLSAEELAQFAALHTGKPNTTVFNDSGAEMKLGYVADTKSYIDNKFNELATALVNNT